MKFCSLLYIADVVDSVNMVVKSSDRKIAIYVNNALLLAASLGRLGHRLTLLTNNEKFLSSVLARLRPDGCNIDVVELSFDLSVPAGIGFYSAHYKIDVFRYFGEFPGEYFFLIDLDIVAIHFSEKIWAELVKSKSIAVFDITDSVIQECGFDVVFDDLRLINANAVFPRWYGGELVGGTGLFFLSLYSAVINLFPFYLNSYERLHHQGDEIIVSAAMANICFDGHAIVDVGALGLVSRYWSGLPRYSQKNFLFSRKSNLLHLPQDKVFLSNFADRFNCEFDVGRFLSLYARYLFVRKIRNIGVFVYRVLRGRL